MHSRRPAKNAGGRIERCSAGQILAAIGQGIAVRIRGPEDDGQQFPFEYGPIGDRRQHGSGIGAAHRKPDRRRIAGGRHRIVVAAVGHGESRVIDTQLGRLRSPLQQRCPVSGLRRQSCTRRQTGQVERQRLLISVRSADQQLERLAHHGHLVADVLQQRRIVFHNHADEEPVRVSQLCPSSGPVAVVGSMQLQRVIPAGAGAGLETERSGAVAVVDEVDELGQREAGQAALGDQHQRVTIRVGGGDGNLQHFAAAHARVGDGDDLGSSVQVHHDHVDRGGNGQRQPGPISIVGRGKRDRVGSRIVETGDPEQHRGVRIELGSGRES